MKLTIDSPVFQNLREDFDKMLARLLDEMDDHGNDNGELNIKVRLLIVNEVDDMDQPFKRPIITHETSKKTEIKEKKSQTINGDLMLEFDRKEKVWLVNEPYRAQTNMNSFLREVSLEDSQ